MSTLTKPQLLRAADILEKIDVLGRELADIMNQAPHEEQRGALFEPHYYATERLSLDPAYWTTPAQMASILRVQALKEQQHQPGERGSKEPKPARPDIRRGTARR